VAQWLIRSGCRLGGEWSRLRDGCIRWGGDHRRGRGSYWVYVGHLTVTSGDFVA